MSSKKISETENILNLIHKNKINPFEIIGCSSTDDFNIIKKKYKKQALLLHPDKTNGKTELDFKILSICYKYIIKSKEKLCSVEQEYYEAFKYEKDIDRFKKTKKEFLDSRDSDEQIKEWFNDPNAPNLNGDWGDRNYRSKYIIDDHPDEKEFLEKNNNKKKYKNYTEALKDNKIENILFKRGEKYDHYKFNYVYDKMKEIHDKNNNVVVKKTNIKDLKPLHSYGDSVQLCEIKSINNVVAIHDISSTKNNMSNHMDKLGKYNELSEDAVLTKDIMKKIKITKKELEKYKKSKESKKLSKREIKDLIDKNRQMDIDPNEVETLEMYFQNKAKKFAKHEIESNDFVKNNLHIFPKQLQQNIKLTISGSSRKLLDN